MDRKHLLIPLVILFSILACAYADPVQQINSSTSFTMQVMRTATAPIFLLYGGNDPLSLTAVGTKEASIPVDAESMPSYVVVSDQDILSENVTVYVRIVQGNLAYQNISLTLTLTANALSLNGESTENANEKTGDPEVGDLSSSFSIDVDNDQSDDFVSTPDAVLSADNKAVFNVTYSGKAVPNIFNGQSVVAGSCSFTWPMNENLDFGRYFANITLSCVVND